MTHWQKYGRAYAIGFIFVFVAVGNAFVSEFENMTAAQEQAMTSMQWAVSYASVLVSAGTTILAFLNQSAAKNPPEPPKQS